MTGVSERVSKAALLKAGASTMVLGAFMVAVPTAAYAQTEPRPEPGETRPLSAQTDPNADQSGNPDQVETAGDEIIVTGQRRALQTSQGIKRNADTVVDSITATDIGAFPDKSVAEALQRVPGITVNRFAASSDTAHFSAEPSGVLVRGLPQVRSEFNGRDTFTANSSRGLSWGDISPELMAGVDTYKNQTAELIEGGIAGSINLRTRVPFDANGELIQFSGTFIYNDLAQKPTFEASGFYSNRWTTGIGDVGIMGNIAYSNVQTRSQGIQFMRAGIFDNAFGPNGPKVAYIPSGITLRDNLYERIRNGVSAAAQWQSPDRAFLLTAQYNRSTYTNEWQERGVSNEFFGLFGTNVRFRANPSNYSVPVPAPGTPAFTFDADGNFQTGTFNRPESTRWFGAPTGDPGWGCGTFQQCGQPAATLNGFALNSKGEPMFSNCYSWAGPTATRGEGGPQCGTLPYEAATDLFTISRYAYTRNMTQDAAINLKWSASDRLRFNFDGQFVDADVQNYDIEINFASFTNPTVDATSGQLPRVSFGAPTNVNQSPGGLANPNNYYIRSVMDHMEDAVGQQWAFRADGEYDIGSEWLDSLKFGARFADREQVVNWGAYNWQNVSNTWTATNAPYFNLDSKPSGQFKGYPEGLFTVQPFGEPFHGGNLGSFPFVPFPFLKQRRANELSRERIGVGNFIPICERAGQIAEGSNAPNGQTPEELPDSCFTPLEVTDVAETTKAAYAMLRFGGNGAELAGMPVSGNIGLRYVNTINESRGFMAYPLGRFNTSQCPATPLVPGGFTGTGTPFVPAPGQPPQAPFPAFCYLTPADIAFSAGGGVESTVKETHHNFLPSLNVRFDLSREWLIRFAASKAMSRPDIGLLKNVGSISLGLPQGTDVNNPQWIKNAQGNITGVTPRYTGSFFNPRLKPITAWQFDLSLENYFADAGSFSLALFYKKFYNYIQYGQAQADFTRGSTTRTVEIRGPFNGSGAEIRGFEVAYQRFFDFLPSPLDGLGVQANYTFVDNKGITNTNVTSVGSGGGETTTPGTLGSALDPGALEGLSKHSFNLVGMYEKGPLALRVAYNWRSQYLVTAYDCCVYLPVWQKEAGFLDATLRYALTDNVELNLRGSNLLNTRTELLQQVTDVDSPEGKRILVPNAWFQNDRRFEIGARVKF